MLLRVEVDDPPRAGMELLIWLTSRCPRAILLCLAIFRPAGLDCVFSSNATDVLS